jgi:hypothetical protein
MGAQTSREQNLHTIVKIQNDVKRIDDILIV